ncbi:hypothetical protein Tco_0577196, partial [Tanacetum coccineum]
MDSSSISDDAKGHGALATGAAHGTRSIQNSTILVRGSRDKSFRKTS